MNYFIKMCFIKFYPEFFHALRLNEEIQLNLSPSDITG